MEMSNSPIPNLYFILVTLVVFIFTLMYPQLILYIYALRLEVLRPEISRPGICCNQRATRCGQHPSQLVTRDPEASVYIVCHIADSRKLDKQLTLPKKEVRLLT